jgi:hypothetical protein
MPTKNKVDSHLLGFTIVGNRVLKMFINAVHRAGGDDNVIVGLLKTPRVFSKIAGLIMGHGDYVPFSSITSCPELIPKGLRVKKDVPRGKYKRISFLRLSTDFGEMRGRELRHLTETHDANLGLSDAAHFMGKDKRGTSFLEHTKTGWILVFPGTVVIDADNVPFIPVIKCLNGEKFSLDFEPLAQDRNDKVHYLILPKKK